MSIPRFLLISALIAVAVPVFAQSLPGSGVPSKSSPTLPAITVPGAVKGPVMVVPGTTTANPDVQPWIAPASPTCYSIRSYRFTPASPGSDVMKPSGYSTCDSASLFHMQDIVTSAKSK